MASFKSDGVDIAYEVYGEGKPIVLVHGFASNGATNWVATGWIETLMDAGFRPISMDNRGHGRSEKLYDPAFYPAKTMAMDVVGLIEHLQLTQQCGPVPIMGYSMGARICAFAAMDFSQKISAVIFGGLGINMIHGVGGQDEIVSALLAPTVDDITSKVGRQFRIFADHTKSDLKALAACMQSSRDPIGACELAKIELPVLVAVGDEDEIGGSAEELANIMPRGEALVISGRDHMRATGDKKFKSGVVDFLARLPK